MEPHFDLHQHFPATLLQIALIFLLAKIGALVTRFGQPAVLGELLMGVLLGACSLIGIHYFEGILHNHLIEFLALLGVIFLLFQVGMESTIGEMLKVGVPALRVAIVGVIVPFFLGATIVGPWLLPGLSFNEYLFLGAILTATSVGITARVFQDLGKIKTQEARIILGAAVIDDVLGLLILAICSAIVSTGKISGSTIALISLKAFGFLFVALFLGRTLASWLGKLLSKIHYGIGMKLGLVFSFGLGVAYLGTLFGLEPIVGAFAAGLILEPVHFKDFDSPETDVNHLVEPVVNFLAPFFFVYTGMQVRLETLFDPKILLIAFVFTLVAFIGKLACGLVSGKDTNRWVIGLGMAPRGEVGLIFANVGKGLGVVDDTVFSVVIIMVIFTTLLPPPILATLLKKK